MKKSFAVLLSLVLALSLTGCGSKEEESADASADAAVCAVAASEDEITVYAGTALVLLAADEEAEEETAGILSDYTTEDGAVSFTCELFFTGGMTAGQITAAEPEEAMEEAAFSEVTLTDADGGEITGYLFAAEGIYDVTVLVEDENAQGELQITVEVADCSYVNDYRRGENLSGVMAVPGSDYAVQTMADITEFVIASFTELCADVLSVEELLATAESSGLTETYNCTAEALGLDLITAEEFVAMTGLEAPYETAAEAEEAEGEEDAAEETDDETETAADNTTTDNTTTTTTNDNTTTTVTDTDTEEDDTDTHTHTWTAVYTTVHHDAVTHEEDGQLVCTLCGASFTTPNAFYSHNASVHENEASYSLVTTTVVDQEAYDETVISYYVCSSCGETKEAD